MRYLLAALLLAACADDLATRDYTVAACPPRIPSSEYAPEVCDRGVGQAPRFVSIEVCIVEVGLPVPTGTWGLDSTHPERARCVAQGAGYLETIDDVRTALTRGAQR
jgi:hypothetical protein